MKNYLIKLLLYAILCGVPGAILVFLIPYFIQNFYGAYFVSVLGIEGGGIILIFVVPYIAFRKAIIRVVD